MLAQIVKKEENNAVFLVFSCPMTPLCNRSFKPPKEMEYNREERGKTKW
jgi:hypothetical protein